jgi:hypothetical protein
LRRRYFTLDPLVFGVGHGRSAGWLELAVGTLAERFPSMMLIDATPVFRHNPQMRDMKSLRIALRGES